MKIIFEQDSLFGYANRTMKNASADATIAFAIDFTTRGEILTKEAVLKQGRQYIPIDANNLELTEIRIIKCVTLLNKCNAKILNIAGNGIYTLREKYKQTEVDNFVYQFLNAILLSTNLINKIELIRSGGQTGFDEAGIKAAIRLNIPAFCLAPKGWKFRNVFGQDISDEQKFKKRFL